MTQAVSLGALTRFVGALESADVVHCSEWFSVLARQMFNPGYALFQPQAADAQIYQPNKVRLRPPQQSPDTLTGFWQASSINPDHLSFFQFVGRIIGKAIYDQRILEAYFSRGPSAPLQVRRIC